MNNAALLALIADLYAQVISAQQERDAALAKLAEKE